MVNKTYLHNTCRLCLIICLMFSARVEAGDYSVAPAEKGLWQQEFMAFGQVTARAESNITLPFSLKITRVEVEPGQTVPSGESLLYFDSPYLLKNLNAYQNSRKLLKLAKKRQQVIRQSAKEHTLTRRQVVGGEQSLVQQISEWERCWDRVRTDLMILNNDMAQAALDALLDKDDPAGVTAVVGVLRAPFGGTVINRPPQIGLWIKANTSLLEFEDLHRVYVTVAVPENHLSDWLNGETMIEKKKKIFKLKRLTGEPGIDLRSGMRLLMFTVDNPEIMLRDGEWIWVRHQSPEEQVVWIPAEAVVGRNNKTWCIIYKDQKYTPRRLETGASVAGKTPVISGLEPGQEVVTENAYELLYRDLKELVQFVD